MKIRFGQTVSLRLACLFLKESLWAMKILSTKRDKLSSIPESRMVEREATPKSCLLTSTYLPQRMHTDVSPHTK